MNAIRVMLAIAAGEAPEPATVVLRDDHLIALACEHGMPDLAALTSKKGRAWVRYWLRRGMRQWHLPGITDAHEAMQQTVQSLHQWIQRHGGQKRRPPFEEAPDDAG